MSWSALPEHLNTPEKVEAAFPDDNQFGDVWFGRLYKWFNKETKAMTAFGPRANEWWARWREWPITLFAAFGEGNSRWENDFIALRSLNKPLFFYNSEDNRFYLSRIQFYCKWSIQLQWPLFFACHWYFKDVRYTNETDGKLIFFYVGAKRDADKVYWFPSAYIGLNWK